MAREGQIPSNMIFNQGIMNQGKTSELSTKTIVTIKGINSTFALDATWQLKCQYLCDKLTDKFRKALPLPTN